MDKFNNNRSRFTVIGSRLEKPKQIQVIRSISKYFFVAVSTASIFIMLLIFHFRAFLQNIVKCCLIHRLQEKFRHNTPWHQPSLFV